MSKSVTELLNERKSTHGDYKDHATCTQELMRVCMAQPNWHKLCSEYKEGIHMIAHKLGRILTGKPYHEDHVADIAGYATLMQTFAKNNEIAATHMHQTKQEIMFSDPINGPE